MTADSAPCVDDCVPARVPSASDGLDWRSVTLIGVIAFACMVAGAGYPLLVPNEARHAGIIHEMWSARQYLVPRIDGLPVLDGSPLFYWLALLALWAFGAEEWALRLPSAVCAAITVGVMAKAYSPWPSRLTPWILVVLFLTQPALLLAGRFASPDMLNALLLTVALGSFLQAATVRHHSRPPTRWLLSAWLSTGLLGLGAGIAAVVVPLVTVIAWLALHRRLRLLPALCWWPGPVAAAVMNASWLLVAELQYPGMTAAVVDRQLLSLVNHGRYGPTVIASDPAALVLMATLLLLIACSLRYHDVRRRLLLHIPTASLLAIWLIVLLPLLPLVAKSLVGIAVLITMPMLYFAAVALTPASPLRLNKALPVWSAYVVLAAVSGTVVFEAYAHRASELPVVTKSLRVQYRATTDKVVFLDRYDHEFNFYLRSPKLVYVVADWHDHDGSQPEYWKNEFLESAAFAPDTAQHMLLGSDAFLERLCERRVVNLWVIGDEESTQRYPILNDLRAISPTGKVRTWYLGAEASPVQCPPSIAQQ